MKEFKYDEIEKQLEYNPMADVVFEEYDSNKELILKIEKFKVHTYIKENEFLDIEDVEEYYGELNRENCYNPYLRLILVNPEEEELKYYPVHLNKVYMSSGFQRLWIESEDTWIS